jgi:hypothetical protein
MKFSLLSPRKYRHISKISDDEMTSVTCSLRLTLQMKKDAYIYNSIYKLNILPAGSNFDCNVALFFDIILTRRDYHTDGGSHQLFINYCLALD